MKALVYDPDVRLRFAELPDPVPTESQILLEVSAVSINFGEVAFLSRNLTPGTVPGWDSAGVVRKAAADGSGPPIGTRVVGFGWSGGWAELRTLETKNLAVLPDSVDFGKASALPVAGVTALQAIRALGPVVGRRVLVTGASGGVGRFAVQLAAIAGAQVVAAVGRVQRGAGLRELGAAEVVTDLKEVGPVFGVLDNVGGELLAEAFSLVEVGGSAQSIGKASLRDTTIDFEAERLRGGRRRLEPFVISMPVGRDLVDLIGLVVRKELDPQVGWRGSWTRVLAAADALMNRQVSGKAVLDVG